MPSALPSAAPAPLEPVLGLSAGAALAGLFVNQLRVTPASQLPATDRFRTAAPAPVRPLKHEVTLYAVFKEPFARRLELRALDALSAEIGRSEIQAPLSRPADSSSYVTFHFDARLPIERVRTFVVYVDPPPEVAATPEPPVKPAPVRPRNEPPRPAPEPEPLSAPKPGLVPKDP